MELDRALSRLARLRLDLEACDKAVAVAQELVDATPEALLLATHKARRDELKKQISQADEDARQLALSVFTATGDKRPAEGVEVRMYKRLRYDLHEVLAWCQQHAPNYVVTTVDVKRFEKAAETLIDAPVTLEHEARVAIATDLSAYLTRSEADQRGMDDDELADMGKARDR
jgi:hypothetical protein